MTGLWQVLGRTSIPFEEMVKLDYLYVTNWSAWGDLQLLLRTLPLLLTPRGRELMSTTPARGSRPGAAARWGAARAMAAAIFALTLIAALGVSRLGASRYEATAQILLQQPDQVNAVLNPDAITSAANVQREVNTNAQLITSVPVIDAVRRQLRLTESVPDLVDRLSVTGEATSNLVEITARDGAPDRAARIATAVAEQYQAYRRRSAQDAIGSAISAAAIRLRGMDAATRGSAEGEALEARLHQLETGAAVATGGVQVVRRRRSPPRPSRASRG